MSHPVFLSMGGAHDTKLAEDVVRLLPAAMVYMYTKTGADHVDFRSEIEGEIQTCKIFVVFWSHAYLESFHAKVELATMKKSLESNPLNREIIVVQVERKGPPINHKWKNPLNSLDEYALGEWRARRAGEPAADATRTAELIKRRLAFSERMPRPIISRPYVQAEIKRSISVPGPGWLIRHFNFVTGFEGHGRRTELEHFMEHTYSGMVPRRVAFDSIDGPEDLLNSVLAVSGLDQNERKEIILTAQTPDFDIYKQIRRLIYQGLEARAYYIILMDRFTAIDAVDLPNWLVQAFSNMQNGNEPLAFFVTSNPIPDQVKVLFPKAGKVKISGLDEPEMAELVQRLARIDPAPSRWNEAAQNLVIRASGSSPSLCQIIMYAMRFEPDLKQLEDIAGRELQSFANSMSTLFDKILEKFKENRADLLALRVIGYFKIASSNAVSEVLEPLLNGEKFDLYHLTEYGLIERLSDDVYRIPPLIQRRLEDVLWQRNIDAELEPLLQSFAERMPVNTDDYGTIYAINKGKANLGAGAPIPSDFELYLTTAGIFKEGLQRYLTGSYEQAHRVLRRAFDRILKPNFLDVSTQVEIARYFGLAAARMESDVDVESACNFLEGLAAAPEGNRQAAAMAAFLQGFLKRVKGRNRDAITNFEAARLLLQGLRGNGRQMGAVLTELSRAHIRKGKTGADKAVDAAKEAYDAKAAPHNLNGLIRAKLFRSSVANNKYAAEAEIVETIALLKDMEIMDSRTGGDFHMVGWADLERQAAFKAASNSRVPELSKAIAWQTKAVSTNARPQNTSTLWLLQIFNSGCQTTPPKIDEVLAEPNAHPKRLVTDAIKYKIFVQAGRDRRGASKFLEQSRQNFSGPTYRWLLGLVEQRLKPKISESLFKEILNMK